MMIMYEGVTIETIKLEFNVYVHIYNIEKGRCEYSNKTIKYNVSKDGQIACYYVNIDNDGCNIRFDNFERHIYTANNIMNIFVKDAEEIEQVILRSINKQEELRKE